ncbi:MAG: ferredoxin--NADP reductase [Rhodobacteraceae bacterium]|nr:MAG: ferredoxin--NADP reductase [Paracoccaceae bacterium]|tara:strand:+ start:132 stop:926 length:795 start_codon:yes stop_codon:yes gene_type:complete
MSEPVFEIPAGVFSERVTFVQHYTDRLFKFRISRPASFRFRSGEFVMIGLPNAEKPIFRAYSIASPSWDEELEFYSIKVEDGPLTQHLQKIKVNDSIIMRRKPTGTLVNDALLSGKRLYLFSTGTGIAPFASLIRDPETYEKFETIILCHSCRNVGDLKYGQDLIKLTREDPLVGELVSKRLKHYQSVTRDEFEVKGRITDLLRSGKIFSDLNLPKISKCDDRGMICGSMEMLKDTKSILEDFGLTEGANNNPSTYVVERAFVD